MFGPAVTSARSADGPYNVPMNDKLPRWTKIVAAALIIAFGACSGSAHPLDPLSAAEINSAVAALRVAGLTDAETMFPLIDLDEPSKAAVLAWRPGQPFNRSAFVVARRGRTVYEGTVDLATPSVTRWQAIPNVQTGILVDEEELARQITLADPGWRAAMRQRGYSSFDKLFCAPFTAGYFADPAEAGRRLLKLVCYFLKIPCLLFQHFL